MKREGKFSRWSRLKQGGGQKIEKETSNSAEQAEAISVNRRPNAVIEREFVPAMLPLAPEEEGDDRLSSGVGRNELTSEEKAESESDKIMSDEKQKEELMLANLTEEQLEEVKKLPSIEKLNADSDYTVFLEKNVPEFLKRRALSVLWRSNPIFGFLDGMNDYDEDYNVIDKVLKATDVTGYKVGRGFLEEDELDEMMSEEARGAFDEKNHNAEETETPQGHLEKEEAAEIDEVNDKAKVEDNISDTKKIKGFGETKLNTEDSAKDITPNRDNTKKIS